MESPGCSGVWKGTEMALRAEYTLHHSDLGEFLGASVWEEENGNPLSVLSAFARLDIDPWEEAARLRSLPKEAAVSALAEFLSRLPMPRRTHQTTAVIADRLVDLLAKPAVAAYVGSADGGNRKSVV